MRIISFAWTTEALLSGKKSVTRRTWRECRLQPGELVQAWDKSPRAKGKRVGTIRIKGVTREPLAAIASYGPEELEREGGLWRTAEDFIQAFAAVGTTSRDPVWRIEFELVERL